MKVATSLILALILMFCLAGAAGAKEHIVASGLTGKLVGVSTDRVIIQQKDPAGGPPHQITIKVDANTTIEINGASGKSVTDLRAGDHVVIQGGAAGPATDIQAKSHKGGHSHRHRRIL